MLRGHELEVDEVRAGPQDVVGHHRLDQLVLQPGGAVLLLPSEEWGGCLRQARALKLSVSGRCLQCHEVRPAKTAKVWQLTWTVSQMSSGWPSRLFSTAKKTTVMMGAQTS